MLPLLRHGQAISLRCLVLWLALSLIGRADELWRLLEQGRPDLAHQHIAQPSPLQQALLAQAEGETGEAWRLVRLLEKSYRPGQQPAEFFWLRALLLKDEQWDLASKNLALVLENPCADEVRLQALGLLALGTAEQHLDAESKQAWSQAALLASRLTCKRTESVVRFAMRQADLQLLSDHFSQAMASLVPARALAQQAHLPALVVLVDLKMAQVESELANWETFSSTCGRTLQGARSCPEPWLVEQICEFWVTQQLYRRSDARTVSQCFQTLEKADHWFSGTARLVVVRHRARLQALALNQRPAALASLRRALAQCPHGKLRLHLLSELYRLTLPEDKEACRTIIRDWLSELAQLGQLEPEDPVARSLPRYGGWAVLAKTYLPEQPQRADEYFKKALADCPNATARMELVNFQLLSYNAAGALPWARKSLGQLLELVRAIPLDKESSQVLRSQMFSLRSDSRQRARLFMTDEVTPAAESPSQILLSELLHDKTLQSKLERQIYENIRAAQSFKQTLEAYLARAELLLTQSRWAEAVLALERMQQSAEQGGWPLRQALALQLQGDTLWRLGRADRAIEAVSQAERLYATSLNAQDQRAASDCKLLRAYFLLRSQRVQEALQLCAVNTDSWSVFLRGRCQLALGQPEQAEHSFSNCHFEEGLPDVGRLIFQARCSPQAGPVYEQAYAKAQQIGSLTVREVALEWSAWLRQQGKAAEADSLEREAGAQLLARLQEYPPELRDRLLDLPATQKLLKSTQPVTTNSSPTPRQSRRTFLARLNEVRQRYPGMDSVLAISGSDLVALQESLPANRVLVQYFAADTDLYIMRVDSQGCELVQTAVERSLLQDWTDQVRQALGRHTDLPALPARRLFYALVSPLGPGLEGKQVQVIPNGLFWYLPWDVLQGPDGRYLVETQEWSCVSPSELVRSGFRGPAAAVQLDRAVTLGGTNAELPATGLEAQAVAALFPHGTALLGAQANASELTRWAPQAQILHLAAHSGVSAELNQTYIELSGGRFSLEQVYGLQLQNGSRVVLSSCESALGQQAPGREVSSLASAFLASGASTVIATLWRVEDDASAAFFQRFYQRLLQQRSVSAALRQARLDCLADPKFNQPHGWGAYQLIGDPG